MGAAAPTWSTHTVTVEAFPMMCMTAETFMQRLLMPSHGELLKGRLLRSAAVDEAVHFISHEWLGRAHPDPNRVQLRRMQAVLHEAIAGRGAELFTPMGWSVFRNGRK